MSLTSTLLTVKGQFPEGIHTILVESTDADEDLEIIPPGTAAGDNSHPAPHPASLAA